MDFYTPLKKCIVLAVYFFPMISVAQHYECGTRTTQEQINYFKSMQSKLFKLEKEFLSKSIAEKNSLQPSSVPISVHIIRHTDGTGGLAVDDLYAALDIVNNQFINAGLEFFICSDINYIDDDQYVNFSTDQEEDLTATYGVPNTVNIYFTESITYSNGFDVCGYAYYPVSSEETIMMTNGCTNNTSTLSHELGHFFGLNHTHNGSNGANAELVDGSNCGDNGDFICDTPADPKLSYATVTQECVYTGEAVDSNNELFQPNTNNVMSFSRKQCRTEFSEKQYARIYAWYQSSWRSNLECPTVNADFEADTTESCDNNLVVNFTDNSIGATSWKWDVDGDGIVDYESPDPTHIYEDYGEYDVSLTVSDDTTTVQKVKSKYIRVGSQPINTTTIDLTLTLDDKPSETSWEFLDENNNIIYSGGPYTDGVDNFTTIQESFDIAPDKCYTFVIYDSYGDGICCYSGAGSYELTANGVEIASSDNTFINSSKHRFFNTTTLDTENFNESLFSLYPNPASTKVNIRMAFNAIAPDSYEVFNTLGQRLMKQPFIRKDLLEIDVENLNSGLYFIKLIKENTSTSLPLLKN